MGRRTAAVVVAVTSVVGASLTVVGAPAPAAAVTTYYSSVSGPTKSACELARKKRIAEVTKAGHDVYHSAPCSYQSAYPFWRGRVYYAVG